MIDFLKSTTPAYRLNYYRIKAAKSGEDWRTVAGDYRTPSPVKINNPYIADCGEHYGMKHCRHIEDTEKAGLRFVGHSDEILPREIEHRGWFVDSFQSETVRGGVWQLPSRRGEMLFVCGYGDPWNDGAAFISFEVVREDTSKLDRYYPAPVDYVEAERDAARWGDSMAERMAEESREENAKFQAEQDIESAREEITELAKQHRALARDLRKSKKLEPAICDAVRSQLQAIHAEVRAQIAVIRERKADYWSAVQ